MGVKFPEAGGTEGYGLSYVGAGNLTPVLLKSCKGWISSSNLSFCILVMNCHPAIEKNSILNTQNMAKCKKYAR